MLSSSSFPNQFSLFLPLSPLFLTLFSLILPLRSLFLTLPSLLLSLHSLSSLFFLFPAFQPFLPPPLHPLPTFSFSLLSSLFILPSSLSILSLSLFSFPPTPAPAALSASPSLHNPIIDGDYLRRMGAGKGGGEGRRPGRRCKTEGKEAGWGREGT